MHASDHVPDDSSPSMPRRRSTFVTLYVIAALLAGSALCAFYGTALTTVYDEYDPDESASRLLDVREEVWVVGGPLVVVGLLTLIGVWLMRTWGLVLAVLVHSLGIVAQFVWILDLASAPGVAILLGFGILVHLWLIAEFVDRRAQFGRRA